MADNNPFPGENNTGHIWDDNIRELSNPPPKWWMISLWASLAWFVAYGFIYPMYPIGSEATKGLTGWTQINEFNESLAEVAAIRAPNEAKIAKMSVSEILKDEGLAAYVEASTKVPYGDYCAACHASGGMGNPGFPVLADDDWLYGGGIDQIVTTITAGRKGMMISHGKMLSAQELDSLADSVMTGKIAENPLYMGKGCFACHGMDGKGMAALGSANLTDSIFRFKAAAGEDQKAMVKSVIAHGVNDGSDPETKEAVMPEFGKRLTENEIKKLAVYVYRLGGGQ